MWSSQLEQIADALEADAGITTAANDTETGMWLRAALAAEDLAGVATAANAGILGYMLRTAKALELLAGTTGAEENVSYEGYLKRIVDAFEDLAGAVQPGSLEHRAVLGSLAAIYNVLTNYRLGIKFITPEYWISGTQYTPITTLPGYSSTRTGEVNYRDTDGTVDNFAANIAAINGYGLHSNAAATNLLLNAGTNTTLVTQNVTVAAVAHTIAFIGTGTITLSGVSTAGPLVGTGATNQVSLQFTPTAGTLTVTVSGDVRYAVLIAQTLLAPFVPIIPTAGASAAIGETVVKHTMTALTDQDALFFARGTKQVADTTACFMELTADATGNNRVLLYTSVGGGGTLSCFSVSGGVTTSFSGPAPTAGQEITLLLRRIGGNWRGGSVVAGVLTWYGASVAGAFPIGMDIAAYGNFEGGTGPLTGPIEGGFMKPGTFTTDAEVLAAVAETA